MLIFFKVADALFTAGGLWIVWHLGKAAMIISSPDPDGINLILRALRMLHNDLKRISSQLGKGGEAPYAEDAEEETGIEEQ